MFLGTSDHHLDSKGRVILPTDFREQLGESFYITMGFNRCAQVMSIEEFDRLREQIRQLPADKALSLQYLLISPAKLVSPNSQGRIIIPQKLREDAGLSALRSKKRSSCCASDRYRLRLPQREQVCSASQ